MEYLILCIVLGALNGLMDDYRDYYPNHLLRRWRYGMRHPEDRNSIRWYLTGNFFVRRVIEVINDVWHLFKSVIFISLILFHPKMEGWLVVHQVTFLFGCLLSFMLAFEIVYHKRWQLLAAWYRKARKLIKL